MAEQDVRETWQSHHNELSTVFKPSDTTPTPAAPYLFAEGESEELDKERAEEFHTFAAKGLFTCKRARPDIC
jgi:hypothetical protein